MQLTEADLGTKKECQPALNHLLDTVNLIGATREQIGSYDRIIDMIQSGEYDPPSRFIRPDVVGLKNSRAAQYQELRERQEEVLVALNGFLVCECNAKPMEIGEDKGAIPGEILAIEGGKIIRCK